MQTHTTLISQDEHQLKQPDLFYAENSTDSHHHVGISKRLLNAAFKAVSSLWIILPRCGRPVRNKALHELHPLAYLDALRGYLALIIFTGHTMSRLWKWIPASVLAIPWLQFPFRGGFASLEIFFWISGYAVTYRLIGFIHAKRPDQFLDALASSIFRRYFRLFLPILPVTFATAVAIWMGLAIPPEKKNKHVDAIKSNLIWWWVKDSAHVLNPFTHIVGYWNGQSGSELIDPFWSLSAEFRSSMILFTFCAGTCRMTSRLRKILIWLCAPAFICWQAQWAAMAFVGMWFAEFRQENRRKQASLPTQGIYMQVTQAADESPAFPTPKFLQDRSERIQNMFKTLWTISPVPKMRQYLSSTGVTKNPQQSRTLMLTALFFYSFIALSDPYHTDEKRLFPHNVLNLLVPDHWHVQMRMHMHLSIGSLMMLYPLDQLSMLQRPLLTPFSQFLGELSFGIYAVHFPIRWIVWDPRYVEWQRARYGEKAMDKFWVSFPGWLAMGILVIWAAELFRRLDMQVVRFCKNLELWTFE